MHNKRYLFIAVAIVVSVSVMAVTVLFVQPDKTDESAGLIETDRDTQMIESYSQKADEPVGFGESLLRDNGPVSLDRSTVDIAANAIDLKPGTDIQVIMLESKDNQAQVPRRKAAKLNLPQQSRRTTPKQPPVEIVAGQLIEAKPEIIENISANNLKGPRLKIDVKDIKTLQRSARRNIAKPSTKSIKKNKTSRRPLGSPRYVRRSRRRRANRPGLGSSGGKLAATDTVILTTKSLQVSTEKNQIKWEKIQPTKKTDAVTNIKTAPNQKSKSIDSRNK